ncbi:alpha/beta hydrolase [Kribbella sp. NBC_01245]|uniref:alpha/beta fold hydrolase n=1 Tax=Kribbella sp. NBC_01245 TaxID=2903578 RepID=UPI002E2AC024|nr:alpha/beta hydrolase [Kribbella sp. NBC_01245]
MTLHFVAYGEGTPVLALHGWTPDHRLMTGCLEPIFAERPGYRRYYPDLPAMGQSPGYHAYSAEDILTAVLAFIDEQIGSEPFLLIGESFGGLLARSLVARRPEQILGLALICPVGKNLDYADRIVPEHQVIRADPALLASLDPAEAAEFAELAVVQSPETLRRFRSDVVPGLAAADQDRLAVIRRDWVLAVQPESGPVYPRPTLVLTGRQDASVGYAEQYDLLPHYPRASFVVLDRAGHNLQFEQPALFDWLISEWLDRVMEAVAASSRGAAAETEVGAMV